MRMARSRGEQFWITRGQLAALGVTTAAVAVLAFFVGLMAGRAQTPSAEVPPQDLGLIASTVETDALTELLAKVEEAASTTMPSALAESTDGPLDFPEELVAEELELDLPEELPEEEPEAVIVEAEPLDEEGPELAPEQVPEEGWAVQVNSYPTVDEANARVSELQDQGFRAFRVDALVRGETWHRVKIGPYRSTEEASEAQSSINEALGTWDSRVTTVR